MSDKASLENVSLESKSSFKLPAGATIVKQSENISVKEIENGFILRKSYDIQWLPSGESEGHTKYEYFSKEWFSKDNPIKITMPKEKSLAEKLD
jgi:hypothetical protein